MGTFAPQAAMTAMSMIANQGQAKAASQAAEANAQASIRQIEMARQIEERRRKEGLKRSLAAQRANFGAAGTGARDGSAAALLAGLQSQADSATDEDRQMANLRIADINRNLAQRRRADLLAASSQRNQFLFDQFRKQLPLISLLDS